MINFFSLHSASVLFLLSFFTHSCAMGPDAEKNAVAVVQEKEKFRLLVMPIIQRVKEIVAKNDKKRHVVAIAGCSAVGKTNFTHKLAQVLKEATLKAHNAYITDLGVAFFNMDDYLQPTLVTKTMPEWAHRNFDPERLHEVIRKVVKGDEHVQRPQWDSTWSHPTKEEVTACYHNVDLVLFEGTYTLCDETTYDFLKYSDCRIFIDAPEEQIVEWNWARELTGSKPRTRELFDQAVAWDMQDYRKVILPTKKYADFVITKDKEHNYQLKIS